MQEKKIDRRNKWQQEHQERVILMTRRDEPPTKDQIKAAAAASGMSVNSWILDLIKKEIFGQ